MGEPFQMIMYRPNHVSTEIAKWVPLPRNVRYNELKFNLHEFKFVNHPEKIYRASSTEFEKQFMWEELNGSR